MWGSCLLRADPSQHTFIPSLHMLTNYPSHTHTHTPHGCARRGKFLLSHAHTLRNTCLHTEDAVLSETQAGPMCSRAPCWPRSDTLIAFTAQSGQAVLIPSTLPASPPLYSPGPSAPATLQDHPSSTCTEEQNPLQKDRATVGP